MTAILHITLNDQFVPYLADQHILGCFAQAKLFVEMYFNNVSGFPLLRASTRQELQEAKDKFIAGLKVESRAELRPCVLC